MQFYCIDLITLLYTFLVISFDRYKEWTICLISSNKFSESFPAFTCAGAIRSICLGVNILNPVLLVSPCFVS